MNQNNKENLLEARLREMHCRPMVKMYQFFNDDEMMTVATQEFDEVKYIEIAQVKLNEYREKTVEGYELAKQLQFGNLDN